MTLGMKLGKIMTMAMKLGYVRQVVYDAHILVIIRKRKRIQEDVLGQMLSSISGELPVFIHYQPHRATADIQK